MASEARNLKGYLDPRGEDYKPTGMCICVYLYTHKLYVYIHIHICLYVYINVYIYVHIFTIAVIVYMYTFKTNIHVNKPVNNLFILFTKFATKMKASSRKSQIF